MGRPKVLPLLEAMRLTLRRLRRNATYQDLHEDFGIGTTTAWDYHQQMVVVLADVLGAADEAGLSRLVEGKVCLIDGTLVPTFNWRHRTDLLSGKHRCHGMNIQLLVDLHGRLIGASRTFPGSWHDVHCFREAGWVALLHQSGGAIGDLGYEGEPDVVRTPVKKRPNIDLRDVERDLNRAFARIRVGAEWGVGHLKNWRILSTRYRADLSRIDTDIQAAVGLQKLNEQFSGRRLTYDRIKTA